jgi:hypothetical protein
LSIKKAENEVLLDKQLLAEGTMSEIEWVFKGCEPLPLLVFFTNKHGER